MQVCTSRRVAAVWLAGWCPISENLIISYGISVLLTHIAGVPLNRVHDTVLNFLHDSYMVGVAVLPIFIIPVKEDDIPGPGFVIPILPQAPVFEPLDTILRWSALEWKWSAIGGKSEGHAIAAPCIDLI